MSLRDLEKTSSDWDKQESSSLGDWYLTIRDTSLELLTRGGICRVLRQKLFVDDVAIYAISLLEEDVLAGGKYGVELLAAFAGLDVAWWNSNADLAG